MPQPLMSRKKPSFPISDRLNRYIAKFNRTTKIPVFYDDLLRFSGSIVVYDHHDEDTLWVRCYYSDSDREEIDVSLKKVYTILHSDGSDDSLEFLNVDAIDYCTFGNSKPFRIKIRNVVNDSLSYFDFKTQQPDADVKIVATEADADFSGVLLAKGKPELVEAINAALAEIKEDGTYSEISEKYFGEDVSQ